MTQTTEKKRQYRIRAAAIVTMIIGVMFCVAILQYFLCIPTGYDENRVMMLHKEPEDSIDVLLIGSSATYSGFASAYAYEKYGFTSFPYALSGSTCTMWKPALQDALRTQDPKLIVVDVFGAGYDHDLISTRCNQIYTIMTHFPLSSDKIALAKEIEKNVDRTSAASLIFPVIRYHENIVPNLRHAGERVRAERYGPSPLKGIETTARARKLAHVDESSFSSEASVPDEDAERVTREFLDYCRSKDIKVMFVKYPSVLTENDPDELEVNLKTNRILEIAEEYGYETLNMQQRFHDIGLIETEDFYNHGHANVRGQRKITEYLGGYLQNEMGIGPSELNEEGKASWEDSVRYYHALADMAEKMMDEGDNEAIGDSPEIIDRLEKYMKDNDL